MTKKTIKDIDLEGKTVFARLDWNVPVKDGQVVDDFRIEATRPTLEYLWSKNCRVIIASHLGRPDGKVDAKYSLRPVAERAQAVFGREIKFIDDCVGPDVRSAAQALGEGETLCLENVRFHPEEEQNDKEFAKQLTTWRISMSMTHLHRTARTHRPRVSPTCCRLWRDYSSKKRWTILLRPSSIPSAHSYR